MCVFLRHSSSAGPGRWLLEFYSLNICALVDLVIREEGTASLYNYIVLIIYFSLRS